MITRKGLLAIILVLTLLLSGCGTGPVVTPTQTTGSAPTEPVASTTAPDPTEPEPTEPEPTDPPTTDASGKDLVTGLYPEDHPKLFSVLLPEEVDNPDDLPVLKWVVLAHWHYIANRATPTQSAVVAINQDLAARGLPFRIQLEFYSLTDFIMDEKNTLYYDLLNFPEVRDALKDADLVTGMFYDEEELKTYLKPITEYVSSSGEPTLKNAVPHENYWFMTTVDGEIYGMPSLYCSPKVLGWDVDVRVFEEYGLEVEDFYGQFWEMDDTFAKVYEKNGGLGFLYLPGDSLNYGEYNDSYMPQIIYAQLCYQFKQITSCFAIDYTAETPQLVNYLETDYIRATQQAVARYYRAGYYNVSHPLDNHVKFTEVDAGFEYLHNENWPSLYADYAIPVSDAQFMCTGLANYVSGICAGSDKTEHSLSLLNLIAEDVEFRKLMLFGVEGEDYKVVNGYRKRVVENERPRREGYYMDYLSPLADFCGFKRSEEGYPVTEEGSTPLESYRKTLDGSTVWYPLSYDDFDLTGLEEELAAINAVLAVQLRSFHTMDQDAYEQMLSDIREAGGDKVLAELQKQFDAWLEEHPGK